MTSLIELMLSAPLTAVTSDDPSVLHAATMEGLPVETWPHGLAEAACGQERVRLLMVGSVLVPWPPRVSSLPSGRSRCRECHERTGRKRPRSEFTGEVAA